MPQRADTRTIMAALHAISVQIAEVEKRVEALELKLTNRMYSEYGSSSEDESSDVSSEGYESAPATFSYMEK